MPILLPIEELTPGMRLAGPFCYRDRVMLPAGRHLSASDIRRLHQKYPQAQLQIAHPFLDEIVKFEDDGFERQVAREAQTAVAQSIVNVEARLSIRAAMTAADIQTMQQTARAVMHFLSQNPVSAALLCRTMQTGSYLADHTAAVFFLAMTLGAAVQGYVAKERMRQTHARDLRPSVAFNLMPLGLGAMFMDVGLLGFSDLFEQTTEQLRDEQREQIREHPTRGADMLPPQVPPATRMIVRTHHENMDGSGYPAQLAGHRLHVFTRIVRICDSFDAATAQRLFREAKTPSRVIWEITVGPYARFYDQTLAQVFAGLMQPFPIGARLRLEDGRYAVVQKYNRANPFRPTVAIAFDERRRALSGKKIQPSVDLNKQEKIRIASYGEEDLSYIYDMDAAPAKIDAECFSTLFDAAYP